MSPTQTLVVVLVGASAVMWGAFGLMDYNVIVEFGAGYPQIQTAAYAVLGGAGAVFLAEIFTETEVLNIMD